MISMVVKILDNSAYAVFPSWAIAIASAWFVLVIVISAYIFTSQVRAK